MPPKLSSVTASGGVTSRRKTYQLAVSHSTPGRRPGPSGGAHTPPAGSSFAGATSSVAGSAPCPVSLFAGKPAPGTGPECAVPIRIDLLQPSPWASEVSVEATPEDYAVLRLDIAAEGVRHALVAWSLDGRLVVVAGLARLRIAKDLGHETAPVVVREFPDERSARLFALTDNLARKHLSVAQRAFLGPEYQRLVSVGSGRRTDRPSSFLTKVNSRAEAARRAGVSEGSVSAIRAVVESGDGDLLRRVLRGETPLQVAAKAAAKHLSADSADERYSPPWLLEAVRLVMGSIDLDPASTEAANRTVQAARIFTREENGLAEPWGGASIGTRHSAPGYAPGPRNWRQR